MNAEGERMREKEAKMRLKEEGWGMKGRVKLGVWIFV
jgi:hypothetical protein